MKLSTFKWRAKHVVDMTKNYFSSHHYAGSGFAEAKWCSKMEPNNVNIMTEDEANTLGVDWPGRPYHLARASYDYFDFMWEWFEMIHYIMSGDWEADMCRDIDEQMLANAY